MLTLNVVLACLLAAVWVSGQVQDQAGLTQDMVPRDSKTCEEIRYNLEQMLYNTYKSSITRIMLKRVLPGLVEPLMPAVCQQIGGYSKALPTSDQDLRPKRQVGGFFMDPMRKIKDPGDHPPPGMLRNPMKDPGDRPAGLMRLPQTMNPALTSILGMAGMANQQTAWYGTPQLPSHVPVSKPFRGQFYGDRLPHGRKRRSVDEEEENSESVEVALHRQKRANGEEEKKGGFGSFSLFGDVPDHKKSSSPTFPSFFFPPFFSPFTRQQSAFNNRRNNAYGPRPGRTYGDSPGYRKAPTNRQAPVRTPPQPMTPPPVQSQAGQTAGAQNSPLVKSPAARTPASQPNAVQPSAGQSAATQSASAASAGTQPSMGQSSMAMPGMGSMAMPSMFQPSMGMSSMFQPSMGMPSMFQPSMRMPSMFQPSMGMPSMFQPSMFQPTGFPQIPSRPALPGGAVFGDRLPSFGSMSRAGRTRRVKRASDNSDSSSSSNSDMVTFGDFTMPADTFHKMLDPRGSRSDDHYPPRGRAYPPYQPPPPPPPAYYPPPPPQYFPPQAPFVGAQQPAGMYPLNGFAARRRFPASRRASYLASRRAALARARQANLYGANQNNYVYTPASSRMAPLPMGAAQPLVYGTRPAY